MFVFFSVSLSLDLINVKDSHNFYVGVSKPWLFVAIQLYWNFRLYCFHFFPNSALPNRGCSLSTDAAYTWTFTVWCGRVDIKTSDLPVTNLRNFFKSSTDRVIMKVFSIWYTHSSLPSWLDESWKCRQLITKSLVSSPWCL